MPCINNLYLDGRLYALATESNSSTSPFKTEEKELIIELHPLPWADKSKLLELVKDVSKITNALHFTRHIDSVTLSGNNLIIKFSQPKVAEAGMLTNIVAGILSLAALIFAVGYLVIGWKLADVKTQEIKLKQNALNMLKTVQSSSLPSNVKETYAETIKKIAGTSTSTTTTTTTTTPPPPSTSPILNTLLKAVAPILSVVLLVVVVVELLPKLMSAIGR